MKWSIKGLTLIMIVLSVTLVARGQHRPYEPTANSILLETENLGNGIRAERYEIIFNSTGPFGTQDVGFITVIAIDNAKLVASDGTNQLTFITGNPPTYDGNVVTNQFSRMSNGQVLDILTENNIPVAVNGTFYNNEYLSLCCEISRFAIINGKHVNPGQSPLANNPALVQYSDGTVNHVERTSEVNVNDPNIVNFITLAKPENNPSTNFNNSNILLTDKGTGKMFVVQTNDAYSTEQLITWTQDNIGFSNNTVVGVLDPGSSTTSLTQNGVFHSPGIKGLGQWASGGLPMFIGVTPDGDIPTNVSPASGITRNYGQSNNSNAKKLYTEQLPNTEASLKELQQVELTIVNAAEGDDLEGPNWLVYPNPSEDILYIDYKLNSDPSDTELNIYDLQGQLIRNIEIDHTVLENDRIRLDINDLKVGSYILQAVGNLEFKIMFIKE